MGDRYMLHVNLTYHIPYFIENVNTIHWDCSHHYLQVPPWSKLSGCFPHNFLGMRSLMWLWTRNFDALVQLRWYQMVMTQVSHPCAQVRTSFGAPISRRRIYMVLIQRDVLCDDALRDFAAFIMNKLDAMNLPVKTQWHLATMELPQNIIPWGSLRCLTPNSPPGTWYCALRFSLVSTKPASFRKDLLLPNNCGAVQKDMAKRASARMRNSCKFLGTFHN